MTEVTVKRGPVVPDDHLIVGNLVEPNGGNGYVVLITEVPQGSFFTGTVVVPDNAYHSKLGYVSDGFAKNAFKQFVGSVTLKV